MYKNKAVGVVVPCYNESRMIRQVLETMPGFVDRVYVVDDCSEDDTQGIAEAEAEKYPELIRVIAHAENEGVGGAIATGYKTAAGDGMDVIAVMAGDGQMAPEDLPAIVEPVALGECDYAKGNRLFTGDAWNMIPKVRYLGNAALSLLTKIASGYWHVADSQSGYTAITREAVTRIDIDRMYRRYGQPNDLLVRLNIYNFRVRDVPIQPVYGIGERSGLRPIRSIPSLAWLLFRLFLHRMFQKYVIRDFHPLVFFYGVGAVLSVTGGLFGAYLAVVRLLGETVATTSALFAAMLLIMGIQFLLFAMWFDMESNKDLR